MKWGNFFLLYSASVFREEVSALELNEYECQWFTYLNENNGGVRDMINYIIPVKGFAYMITFGVREGRLNKYRMIFDEIVKSFKADVIE